MWTALQYLAPLVPVLAGVLLACEFRGRGLWWRYWGEEE